MSNQTEEQSAFTSFRKGQKLWWKGGGYGYERRIPVEALEMSASGKTCYCKFMVAGRPGDFVHRFIKTTMLESRSE